MSLATEASTPAALHRFSQRIAMAQQVPISKMITVQMQRALERPELISLAAGFVDNETLPVERAGSVFQEIFAEPSLAKAALQYGTTAGYPPLRDVVLSRLAQSDGVSREEYGAAVEQVLVTAGSNQLLHLLSEVMLDPGDVVLCAAPTYFVVLGTLAGCGAQAMGVATDDHGMIPEALAEQFAAFHCRGQSNRVKLVYVVSYSDNPRGVTMPRERREQLLEVVDRHNRQVHSGGEHPAVHVVADDAYRELRYGKEAAEEDVPSMRSMDDTRETVIHVETFSKSFSPGIRVGWGLLPEHLVGPLLEVKGNVDFGSPNLNQHVVHRAMERGLFDEHVANLRQTYRPKLEATLSAAKEHLAPLGVESVLPSGGLYVWCELPPPMDAGPESELFAASLEEGMMYVPGELCFARTGEPVRRNTLRLSFGVQSPERIREGVAALARAIAKTHP